MRVTNENWLDAQHSVLGAALIDEKAVPKVMAETSEDDFTGSCQTVYRVMRQLFDAGQAVDPQSVNHRLGGNYGKFLIQLMEITPTAANVDHYIALCREQAQILAVRDLARELVEVDTKESAHQLLDRANALMANRQHRKSVNMADALRSFMERNSQKIRYLPWPIQAMNDFLFCGSDEFVIIGAEPSVGKTAFALQCAWYWARTMKVGFFSLETSTEKLFDRLMASTADLSMQRIKNRDLNQSDWDKFGESTTEVMSRKLELIPASGYTTADIRAKIMEGGYNIAVIDYIQLVTARGSNRYEQVTNISIDLHNLAQTMGVVVVALSQLSRSDDERQPKNSDLRESGQLEQDADVIMMLQLEKKTDPQGPRKLFVTKNKEGELFQTLLSFDGKRQIFSKAQRTGETASKYSADGKKAPHGP